LIFFFGNFACTQRTAPSGPEIENPNLAPALIKNGKPEFRIRDIKIGEGQEAKNGMRLTAHYTAWLFDASAPDRRGKEFESTQGKQPYEFLLGRGDLLPGWEQGFFGFQEGGRRELTIPPELAYGEQGFPGKVPPKTAVVYEIELLKVTNPEPPKHPPKGGRRAK
jgi:FKBP-type peptidyl-prolyl cis-trans isomerase